jgi:hypothetical protein
MTMDPRHNIDVSKASQQGIVMAIQGLREPLQGKQGGAFLSGFDHLNITLGHVGLNSERILTQLCLITQSVQVPAKSLQRAFGCLFLHPSKMPNQGFA